MKHGYDDRAVPGDEVAKAVKSDNRYNGPRHTKQNDGPGHATGEVDPYKYSGGGTDAPRLTGDMANGTVAGDPDGVKIGGYADSPAASKNPAYAAQSEQSKAAAYAAFTHGLKGNAGVK